MSNKLKKNVGGFRSPCTSRGEVDWNTPVKACIKKYILPYINWKLIKPNKILGNNTSRNFADRDTDVRESQNRSARYGSQHGHDRRQSGNFEHNDQHFSPNRDNNGQDRFKQDFNRSGHIWDGNNRDQLGHNNRGGRFSQDGNGQGQQQRDSDQRPGHPGKQIGRGSWQRGGNDYTCVNYVFFAK